MESGELCIILCFVATIQLCVKISYRSLGHIFMVDLKIMKTTMPKTENMVLLILGRFTFYNRSYTLGYVTITASIL